MRIETIHNHIYIDYKEFNIIIDMKNKHIRITSPIDYNQYFYKDINDLKNIILSFISKLSLENLEYILLHVI